MSKRPSAGDYLGSLGEPEDQAAGKAEPKAPKPETPTRQKERITVYLTAELYQEARSAVLALGAEGVEPGSISALLDGALSRELARLRKRHNAGEPWPLFKGALPGGRPRKG